MAIPILDGRAWTGRGERSGANFVVELFESRKEPGSYHYALVCVDDSLIEVSERPVNAQALQLQLNALVQEKFGMQLHELDWEETPAEELVLMGERARAGE